MYIGQAPGQVQPTLFRFTTIGETGTLSGRDDFGLVLQYTPGFIKLFADGRFINPADYLANDGSQIIITSQRRFPAGTEVIVLSETPFSPANVYSRSETETVFTRKRNRILNPAMQVSQERGATVAAAPSGAMTYVVDGCILYHVSDATINVAQVPSSSPAGSPNIALASVTSTDAALGTTQDAHWLWRLEGLSVADLQWGTANAKPIVLRFGVNFPAGTYTVHIRNGVIGDRSWLGSFTITPQQAGSVQLVTFNVPGDAVGTWQKDNGVGMNVGICIANGVPGNVGTLGWQGGAKTALAGQTNGLAAVQAFYVFDVGLYEGSVVPPFEVPDYGEELRRCQRYWEIGAYRVYGLSKIANDVADDHVRFKVTKRAVPTVTTQPTFSDHILDTNVTFLLPDMCSIEARSDASGVSFLHTGYWKANARL